MTTPTINELQYFATSVYNADLPEFLETTKLVSEEYLEKIKKIQTPDPLYMSYQSENFDNEPKIVEFLKLLLEISWDVLNGQGYNTVGTEVFFTEFWAQEHYKYSCMEQHAHGSGGCLTGVYVLEAPDESMRFVLHDPRPTKIQASLPETTPNEITAASNSINFPLKSGTLFITNSWLPHSFTKNGSDLPVKFIHFNIGIRKVPSTVEVI